MRPRTIILLSLKRSGTTAVFRMFQRHPEVGVAHIDQGIANWEPNFWNYAADAIAGRAERYVERCAQSFPFLMRAPRDEGEAFDAWDRVLEELGPIVLDKTSYLGYPGAIDLLLRYREAGRDVRFIGLVRDPRDVIVSQLLRLGGPADDSPGRREAMVVERLGRLESLRSRLEHFPVVRQEDLAAAPDLYAPILLEYAGVAIDPMCWDHLAPVNRGEHRTSPALHGWRPSAELSAVLDQYGYEVHREAHVVS